MTDNEKLIAEMDRLFPPNDGNDWDGNVHVREEKGVLKLFDTQGSSELDQARSGEFSLLLKSLDEFAYDTYDRFWDILLDYGFEIEGTDSW